MIDTTFAANLVCAVVVAVSMLVVRQRLRKAEARIRDLEERPVEQSLVEVIPRPAPGDIVVLRGFSRERMDTFARMWQQCIADGKPVLVQGKSDSE